jgi:hypothetical protein
MVIAPTQLISLLEERQELLNFARYQAEEHASSSTLRLIERMDKETE